MDMNTIGGIAILLLGVSSAALAKRKHDNNKKD